MVRADYFGVAAVERDQEEGFDGLVQPVVELPSGLADVVPETLEAAIDLKEVAPAVPHQFLRPPGRCANTYSNHPPSGGS